MFSVVWSSRYEAWGGGRRVVPPTAAFSCYQVGTAVQRSAGSTRINDGFHVVLRMIYVNQVALILRRWLSETCTAQLDPASSKEITGAGMEGGGRGGREGTMGY